LEPERAPARLDAYDSVLVISDAHIGLSDDEVFGDDFKRFLKTVSSASTLDVVSTAGGFQFAFPGAIVLLGDFLDLWDGRISDMPSFLVESVRALTQKADVFYLRGNHDHIVPGILPQHPPAVNRFEIQDEKSLRIGGRTCYFLHGHQFMPAFGSLSLKIESIINPYYTLMQSFLSHPFRKGPEVIWAVTVLFFLISGALVFGQSALASWPTSILALFILFGLLLPLALVTAWRLLQKSLWRGLTLIVGDAFNRLRGAHRGDDIDYLTKPTRPISRWFERNKERLFEAGRPELICFGHTHIPEGPKYGNDVFCYAHAGTYQAPKPGDDRCSEVRFLNPGSWMLPPDRRNARRARWPKAMAGWAPVIKRSTYEKLNLVLVMLLTAFLALSVVFAFRGSTSLLILFLPPAVALLVFEVFVALGKSSYRKIPERKVGVRSLAFIGQDTKGAWRETLLYWNQITGELSSDPLIT
jgi:UDP-2,3-diacylglucosamine pyrophosphatase LpxH